MSDNATFFVAPPPPGRPYVLLGLTVLAALLGCAAFPPVGLGGLGWLTVIPLFIVLGQIGPRQGFWHGWLYGTIFMGGNMAYIGQYGFLPWFALCAAHGLCFGLLGITASLLRYAAPAVRVPSLAAAWTLMELLRGHFGPIAVTFGDLAYSQHLQLGLIQIASLVGHYGVGFVMALLGAGVATVGLALLPQTWWRPGDPRRYNRSAGRVAVACFALVFVIFTWGEVIVRQGTTRAQAQADQEGVRMAAVQAEGSTIGRAPTLSTDASLDRYLAESRKAAGADLIVWPETAVLTALNLTPGLQKKVGALARELKANLLVGAIESRDGKTYNNALFYAPDGRLAGSYRKMDLVFFGEYVPYREQLPFLKKFPIREFDYSPGTQREVFHSGRYSFAPLICFEGVFPGPVREVARLGAQVIVILTSDVWAVKTFEMVVSTQIAPFRAIEARKYVVRAATNGRSAIIDPFGNVLSPVGFFTDGVATANVVPKTGLSFYHRYGDRPLLVLCVVLVLAALYSISRPRS